jgi:hypothetical protein
MDVDEMVGFMRTLDASFRRRCSLTPSKGKSFRCRDNTSRAEFPSLCAFIYRRGQVMIGLGSTIILYLPPHFPWRADIGPGLVSRVSHNLSACSFSIGHVDSAFGLYLSIAAPSPLVRISKRYSCRIATYQPEAESGQGRQNVPQTPRNTAIPIFPP